jgi:hypothetical protein
MSEYLILIYENEAAWANVSESDAADIHKAHTAFAEQNASVLRGGNALQPTSTATSLRGDSTGSVTVTDGAFAETKEALGGYYLIEVEDLDAAVAVARQVPARFGGVEVRPILPVM